MKKKGWLGHRIEEAQKEMDSWPEWMKAAAKFEGSERDGIEQENHGRAVESKPTKKIEA